MSEWQPIETAQTGNSMDYSPRILGVDKSGDISITYHDGDFWRKEERWEEYYDILQPEEWHPTHWMPLPKPPEASA